LETFDLSQSIFEFKTLKPYQQAEFLQSKDGKSFVKSLRAHSPKIHFQKSVNRLCDIFGLPDDTPVVINANSSINIGGDGSQSSMQEPDCPAEAPSVVPATLETYPIKNFPHKRLKADEVYDKILSGVLWPLNQWVRESNLCLLFAASPDSIKAALFDYIQDGSLAVHEEMGDVLYARM
jgi:hypothetical protein